MKRTDIIEEANKWVGTPWRHQGRNSRGIDCAGLVLNVGNDLKLMDYHCANYPRNTCKDHFLNHFKIFGIQKEVVNRKPGDMILFRDGIYACHCGILDVRNGLEYIIHSYHNRKTTLHPHGTTVSEPLTQELKSKMTHCFSYKGLEDE